MSAPLDLLAGVVAREAAALQPKARSRKASAGVRKTRRESGAEADSKRAQRAERNRQSAAASRDRKKQHLRDLETRVRYLGDMTAALGAENARLAKLLAAAMADNEMLRMRLAAPK